MSESTRRARAQGDAAVQEVGAKRRRAGTATGGTVTGRVSGAVFRARWLLWGAVALGACDGEGSGGLRQPAAPQALQPTAPNAQVPEAQGEVPPSVRGASSQAQAVSAPEAPPASGLTPQFTGQDSERARIAVALVEVAGGFERPTDLQWLADAPHIMLVLEKAGRAQWVNLQDGSRGTWLQVEVLTESEQGLLGLALHPDFRKNGKFFTNSTGRRGDAAVTQITAYQVANPAAFPQQVEIAQKQVLLQVEQPYSNHNAGQLQFGPDGFLYVGLGDGGLRADPQGNGQNTETLLGSMLRIDVDSSSAEQPYAVPADNPFVGQKGFRPEIWAYGLRNPWRYSFSERGWLVVADVGQDRFEEIDVVEAGDNLGWNVDEAFHCFEENPACDKGGRVPPVYEYSHDEGLSITGGYEYTGAALPQLQGHYVFGDYVTGRVWALQLPRDRTQRAGPPKALGRWPLAVVTFGRDPQGEIYLADYGKGSVFRIAAPAQHSPAARPSQP